jgi:lysophospholipase L1-like esterase
VAIAACAAIPEQAGRADDAQWIESWSASPLPPSTEGSFFGPSPSFENQTIRQVVRLSAGGAQVRVRLTNEYGSAPLEVGAASIALSSAEGAPAGEAIPLTFSGRPGITIAAGAPAYSDPVDLPAQALQSLSISVYFPEATGPCTCHLTGVQTAYVSAPGDFTAAAFEPASTLTQRAFLGGVQVRVEGEAETIVALGDSITDGIGATLDGDDRWPDVLAERLAARGGAVVFSVSNQGISGNRLLSGGPGPFGESILARLDRDVLSVPGVEHVVLLIGVNDLGLGFARGGPFAGTLPRTEVSEETMLAGYRQVIARAHMRGLKIYGATILPYNGTGTWTEEGEALRQTINAWIREGGEFDGVIDFDAAVRDPADPSRIADGLHAGDFLHGSPAGYAAMAAAVDLSLFE